MTWVCCAGTVLAALCDDLGMLRWHRACLPSRRSRRRLSLARRRDHEAKQANPAPLSDTGRAMLVDVGCAMATDAVLLASCTAGMGRTHHDCPIAAARAARKAAVGVSGSSSIARVPPAGGAGGLREKPAWPIQRAAALATSVAAGTGMRKAGSTSGCRSPDGRPWAARRATASCSAASTRRSARATWRSAALTTRSATSSACSIARSLSRCTASDSRPWAAAATASDSASMDRARGAAAGLLPHAAPSVTPAATSPCSTSTSSDNSSYWCCCCCCCCCASALGSACGTNSMRKPA
mmetsp:Transcript_7239/g.18492  ORF Transcript_7239/g.18492 Transcript_7239/m.18492 type:complete len:296 (-) Transcript_7239:362-1249(-)